MRNSIWYFREKNRKWGKCEQKIECKYRGCICFNNQMRVKKIKFKQLCKNVVYKSGCIIYSFDSITWDLYVFFWRAKKLYVHMYIFSIAVPVLWQGLELYVRMLRYLNSHTKHIPFVAGCGHINYADFSLSVAWMSGRGATM